MKKKGIRNAKALQAYFNARLLKIVTKHGKHMEGWDEILHPDLPKDIVIQSWRGGKSLAQAAAQGYPAILSSGYYLDLMQPASQHYAVDPLGGPADSLTSEQKANILGGEACMWDEYSSPETLDARLWPRTAAIAERLWSPAAVKDPGSMYERLSAVSFELETLGLRHRANYRPMLERLANGGALEPLQTLADVLEPAKGYSREHKKYTTRTPLNRLVDAVRPESDIAREFNQVAERFTRQPNPADREYLLAHLTQWKDTERRLAPVIERAPLLTEIRPLSASLTALSTAGLQALGFFGPEGRASATVFPAEAAKKQVEMLVMIAPGVQKLVEAAQKSQ